MYFLVQRKTTFIYLFGIIVIIFWNNFDLMKTVLARKNEIKFEQIHFEVKVEGCEFSRKFKDTLGEVEFNKTTGGKSAFFKGKGEVKHNKLIQLN